MTLKREESLSLNLLSLWEVPWALLKVVKIAKKEWRKILNIWTNILEIIVETLERKWEHHCQSLKNLNQEKN